MLQHILTLLSTDTGGFIAMIVILLGLRYFILVDIAKKEHKSEQKNAKKEIFFYTLMFFLVCIKTGASYFKIDFLSQIAILSLSLFILSLISLYIQGKILVIYGEEIEVSGQKFFKKGYKASLFSLFINFISFLIGIFLCIEIFDLNTLIEIGGLWAGILAFMGFTAPVWALDMIAGIILLQSKNYESGNVFYIFELKKYVWLKSISLTEVKCIDLKTSNPILYRPSKFRDLTVQNISLGIVGKTTKVLREMNIKVDYHVSKEILETLCYEAFDTLQVDLLSPEHTNYFGDDPYRELVISNFGDNAVEYKLFFSISSPFYIYKAERMLHEYLFKYQQEREIYFSTPGLISITETKKEG